MVLISEDDLAPSLGSDLIRPLVGPKGTLYGVSSPNVLEFITANNRAAFCCSFQIWPIDAHLLSLALVQTRVLSLSPSLVSLALKLHWIPDLELTKRKCLWHMGCFLKFWQFLMLVIITPQQG
jgi:hypothetical protein